MDEKRKLRVVAKAVDLLDNEVEESLDVQNSKPKNFNPNQTNPQTISVYKNLSKFVNSKIGDKWSIRDLLR